MADWYGGNGGSGTTVGGYRRSSMRDEDFEEEDVWSVMKGTKDSSTSNSMYISSPGSSSSWHHLPSSTTVVAPRMIPTKVVPQQQKQSSAPLNIPDWSKIYGKRNNARNMCSWADHNDRYHEVNGGIDHHDYDEDGDGDDDGDDDMEPPHEWLARKLARSQISSFSVCEGIGRTLKGRDLSEVRNAILTKTGFLE